MRNFREEVKDKSFTILCPKCKKQPVPQGLKICIPCSVAETIAKENKSK